MEQYSSETSRGQRADIEQDIENIRSTVEAAARIRANDCEALLALLRQLEELHRDIRETLFQESLPTNRQRLYNLLRDIEVNGGWPHIQRMKLMEFLDLLEPPLISDDSGD